MIAYCLLQSSSELTDRTSSKISKVTYLSIARKTYLTKSIHLIKSGFRIHLTLACDLTFGYTDLEYIVAYRRFGEYVCHVKWPKGVEDVFRKRLLHGSKYIKYCE